MDRRPPSGPSFWHYLIKDNRATEQLDQLCFGLATIIVSQLHSSHGATALHPSECSSHPALMMMAHDTD